MPRPLLSCRAPQLAVLAERAVWDLPRGAPSARLLRRRLHWRSAAAAGTSASSASGSCHYQTLGLPQTASRDDVKRAFRRLARQWHPDVNPSPTATERFTAISAAFRVLSDDQQRQRYDEARYDRRDSSSRQGGSAGRRDSSRSTSGGGGGGGSEQRQPDLVAPLQLDFREAALGGQRSITLQVLDACLQCGGSGAQPGSSAPACTMCRGRREIVKRQALGGAGRIAGSADFVVCCPVCDGRGFDVAVPCSCCCGAGLARQPRRVAVRVPAGSEGGDSLLLAGEGDIGRVGGPRGAIRLDLQVGQEEGMWRAGLDLHSQLAVPLWDALLGCTAVVSTLRGSASLSIPPGTQHGAVLSLQRAGVRREGGGGGGGAGQRSSWGAHHFEVLVQLPREVGSAEQQLLQRLAELNEQPR